MERMTAKQYNEKYGGFMKEKKNKFNAKKVEMGGKSYDSTGEMTYAWELQQQVKAGLIKSFEEQVKEPMYMNDKFICNYFVDFKVIHNDGRIEFIEYKGIMTETARLKIKMLEAKYDTKVTIAWHKPKYKFNPNVRKYKK